MERSLRLTYVIRLSLTGGGVISKTGQTFLASGRSLLQPVFRRSAVHEQARQERHGPEYHQPVANRLRQRHTVLPFFTGHFHTTLSISRDFVIA